MEECVVEAVDAGIGMTGIQKKLGLSNGLIGSIQSIVDQPAYSYSDTLPLHVLHERHGLINRRIPLFLAIADHG